MSDTGEIVCECIYDFGEDVFKMEFIGIYYKTYNDNGEIYYSNDME